jgi:curved DNA-binding protein CbpA
VTLEADPYRTLGLARGATLDEIKRAYRRLAKANHPDAAGESALPRFLAIQAAYEQLVGGTGATGKGRRSPTTPRRPWDADPDRSDATRRAYGGRGRTPPPGPGASPGGPTARPPGGPGRPSGTTSGAAGASGPAGATGTTSSNGTSGTAGRRGADDGRTSWSRRSRTSGSSAGGGARPASGPADGATGGTTGGSRRRADRPGNKATLGSTSYDGVEGPFEPDWGGASWYGTTSGTYWTLNPKEYADPRKHGPEYQARARRTARSRADAEAANGAVPPDTDPGTDAPDEPIGPAAAATGSAQAEPTHTTTSWWESTAGRAADPADGPADRPRQTDGRDAAPSVAAPPPPDLGRAFAEIVRAITDVQYGGWRGRVVRALIGWLPIALGLGWLIGELTGCGRFAATCDGSADPIGLALQLAVLALLLAVPMLASLTTMAALTVLGASLVAALILSATGSAADGDSRRAALGFVLVVAWVVGFGAAIWRRLRTTPVPTGPVS